MLRTRDMLAEPSDIRQLRAEVRAISARLDAMTLRLDDDDSVAAAAVLQEENDEEKK